MTQFNADQARAFDAAATGANVFITGSAGTGKSFVIKHLKSACGNAVLTSTTGIGATVIGGVTLHSALCIGLAKDSKEKLLKRGDVAAAFRRLEVLIIDEISMLSGETLDLIDEIAKHVRDCARPFGGIQIICSGDFLQLPPVTGSFAFESAAWKAAAFEVVELTKIIRQQDPEFANILQYIRRGIVTKDIRSYFRPRLISIDNLDDMRIKPTMLFSRRDVVDKFNQGCLDVLLSDRNRKRIYDIKVTSQCRPKDSHVPEKVGLCIGAQVILIANLNVDAGLVNGSRGIVVDFRNGLPVVEFMSCTMTVERWRWEVRKDDKILYSYSQIPLLLGWAITIHKSQGMTLDSVIVDLAECFSHGQTYVALSRARTLHGLYLFRVDWSRVSADPRALNFYKNI